MYEVVWPRGTRRIGTASFAKRLGSLEGKTICELWNRAYRGDELFPLIRGELSKRFPTSKIVGYETFGSTLGVDERKTVAALSDDLRRNGCDAVISGVGC